jgi:hypothetical protein
MEIKIMKNLTKTALLLAVAWSAVLVAGCSGTQDPSREAGEARTTCIDGVEYLYFKGQSGYAGFGYMSVKFNRDSTVALCN